MSDTETVEPVNEAPNLVIQDIENALKIIDFAAEQGAFKGWTTIQQVFAVRGRLAAFVNYAQASAAPAVLTEETPVAETPAA
jgi:hypothetical protein